MNNPTIIYLYGSEWHLFTTAPGEYMLKLRMDNGTQVTLPIEANLAIKFLDWFVNAENQRHDKEVKKLTQPE